MEESARTGDQQALSALEPRVPFRDLLGGAAQTCCFAIIETLWLQISPYFHLLHASGNYFKANEQHELMLAGLQARDAAAVSLAIRDDIDAAARILTELLGSAPGDGGPFETKTPAVSQNGSQPILAGR